MFNIGYSTQYMFVWLLECVVRGDIYLCVNVKERQTEREKLSKSMHY